ncbi:MAG TPA: SGNH/GDSL hydrolase family protein [Jatrophihabitans sp.]|jgi:lysophospholipase L1-like esterase|uniref:SGNH/GDSL hydrolase family protein n=1 Tax=Jatrophihabitans sp. TaxID=1932789 RepID=UPI002E008A7F|nr:SGNH/GDSL hydrolase family protein [Jatrophihabitans sp.]
MVSIPAAPPRRPGARLRRARPVVAAAGVLGVLGLGGAAPPPPPPPVAAAAAVEIAVIGDSLSTGAMTPGDAWTDEALPMLDRDGREVYFVNAAENGAGYVARGSYGDTFADEVDHVVSPRTRIVIVFGSDNDLGQPQVGQAAIQTLSRVRALAPSARVIVVGPPAPPAQSRSQLQPLSDALHTAATAFAASFVDALALRWFQSAASVYVGSDGEHPDRSGEAYLARNMADIVQPVIARLTTAPARVQASGRRPG